jgi:hypothetical protein
MFQCEGAVTTSPIVNSIVTILISRIRDGWQKRGYIYALVGKSSGFHHVLTNQLLGGGWSRAGASWVMACCRDVSWNLKLRGLVESQTACRHWILWWWLPFYLGMMNPGSNTCNFNSCKSY